MASEKKARKPGRPPSRPAAPPVEKLGVREAPAEAGNRFELVSDNPLMFKKLFEYYRLIKAKEILVRCAPDGLTLYAVDHSQTMHSHAYYEGAKACQYFCAEPALFTINYDTIHHIFATIDKTFHKITVAQSASEPDHLDITLHDALIDKVVRYRYSVPSTIVTDAMKAAVGELEREFADALYPIAFTLSSAQFKKSVTDPVCESVDLELFGTDGKLRLRYAKGALICDESYEDSKKIGLVSRNAANNLFSVKLNTVRLRSIATTTITNTLSIRCREDGHLLFSSAIDDCILLRVLSRPS